MMCRVNARSFEPYLYHYGLKCSNRKGEIYSGFLGKTPAFSAESLITETNPTIRSMAEEMTRTILELIENGKKLIVIELTLVFVMENAEEPQLWLLGASLFRFISKERQLARRRRINIKLNSVNRSLIVPSKKFTDYLPVTTKLPPALRKLRKTHLTGKRRDYFSFDSTTVDKLKGLSTDSKEVKVSIKEKASQTTKKLPPKVKFNTPIYTKSPQVKMNQLLNKPYNQFKFFQNSGFETACNYSTIYEHFSPNKVKEQVIPLNMDSSKQSNRYSPLNPYYKKIRCAGDFCKQSDSYDARYPIDELVITLGKIKPFSIQGIVAREIFPLKVESKLGKHAAYGKIKTHVESDFTRSHNEMVENIYLERISKALREQIAANRNILSLKELNNQHNKIVYICRQCKTIYTKIARTIGRQLLDQSQ